MPSIKDESTVEVKPLTAVRRHFCRIYCINGHNAAQAYKEAYPNTKSGYNAHGARLTALDSIQAEIRRIEAVAVQESGRTVESLDGMYQKGFDVAEKQKNPTGMATNTTGIARLYGMDKDAAVKGDTPEQLTGDALDEIKAMAKAGTALRLAKGA